MRRKLPAQAKTQWGRVSLPIDFRVLGDCWYSRALYFKDYEWPTVRFLQATLKPGDTFIDAGANAGYMSALGASLVGPTGAVHSFEPNPIYQESLQQLVELNKNYKITVNKCALGDTDELKRWRVPVGEMAGGGSLVPGLAEKRGTALSAEDDVKVIKLDSYFQENGINSVKAIKIDVEGYEFKVLKGLTNYFGQNKDRAIIICEMTPDIYDLKDAYDFMRHFGYKPFDLLTPSRVKTVNGLNLAGDVIFKPNSE